MPARPCGVKYVDPERMSLPKQAAGVDPKRFLCPERLKVFSDLNKPVLPQEAWPVLPKACYMIAKDKEQAFRRRVIDTGMAV